MTNFARLIAGAFCHQSSRLTIPVVVALCFLIGMPGAPGDASAKTVCKAYSPLKLRINAGNAGFLLYDPDGVKIGNFGIRTLAEQALTLAMQYKEFCVIGNLSDHQLSVMYWRSPIVDAPKRHVPQDCLPYNPRNLSIANPGPGRYRVQDGSWFLWELPTVDEAKQVIQVAMGHNSSCYISRNDSGVGGLHYRFHYFWSR